MMKLIVNPHKWLLNYFYECAMQDGASPSSIENYLPWKMPQEIINAFSAPLEDQQPLETE